MHKYATTSPGEKTSFSCVIPLYNKRGFVERAVRSVLSQSLTDWELIIVDDGSTDGSVESFSHIHDDRIRIIRQENAGVSAARNTGIKASSHEYIALLDADDEWLPHFLSTASDMILRFPDCGIYATSYYRCIDGVNLQIPTYNISKIAPHGEILSDYFDACQNDAVVWSSAVVLSKRAVESCGGFPVGVKTGEDNYTWARIALIHQVAWSPLHCAIYHFDAGNNHASGSEIKFDVATAAVLQCPEAWNCKPNQRISLQKYINRHRITLAAFLIAKLAPKQARTLLIQICCDGDYSFRLFVLYAATFFPSHILTSLRRVLNAFRQRKLFLSEKGIPQ